MNTPQHPGNQVPQQQGLGAPTENVNTYYKPNVALQQAEVQKAKAGAEKQYAEAAMIQQAQMQAQQPMGPQGLEPGPTVQPQEVQAQQIADGIIQGQLGQEQLVALVQSGEVEQGVAEAALSMANQFMQQDQQRMEQADVQGLGQYQ